MFECKYPLLEVIRAIEKIREAKGPTEVEVLDYVRKHVQKPDDPVKVLKTIRTLKKLVEDGVLVQKGKRYMFSQNPPESSEEEEEEEEACEDEGEAMDMEPDDCEGGNENGCEGEEDEDDDDDDDDETEDDDDDDDDSEECDEKETLPEGEGNKEQTEGCDDDTIKTLSKNKNFLSPSKTSDNVSGKDSNPNSDVTKCVKSAAQDKKSSSGKTVIKGNKANNMLDQKNSDGKNKGGEAIAFCARDFIDSQYRPQSGGSSQIQASKSDDVPQNIIMARSEKFAYGGGFPRRKGSSRMKRAELAESYRSRSPLRGPKPELYDTLRLDHHDEIGSISSQLFREPADTEMEVDGGEKVETGGGEFDVFPQRSPLEPAAPGAHIAREESCCSNFEAKNQTELKLKPNFEDYSLKMNISNNASQVKCKENQGKWAGDAEKRADKHKRGMSSDDEKVSDDARESLCSICEKKKRNS